MLNKYLGHSVEGKCLIIFDLSHTKEKDGDKRDFLELYDQSIQGKAQKTGK